MRQSKYKKISRDWHYKKRTVRPKKTTEYDDRVIYREARRNPTYSLKSILGIVSNNLSNSISFMTVSRRLISRGLSSFMRLKNLC